jgi:rubrerythrin
MVHCADKNENARAQMLLKYLSDHEDKLAHVTEEFESRGDEHALNTWCYEYLNKKPIVKHLKCDEPFSEQSTTEIMNAVIDLHKQVIELYRYLRARADIPSAQELLDQLCSFEEHEMMQMVQSANRLEDM